MKSNENKKYKKLPLRQVYHGPECLYQSRIEGVLLKVCELGVLVVAFYAMLSQMAQS